MSDAVLIQRVRPGIAVLTLNRPARLNAMHYDLVRGLSGEDIPLGARIIHVADAFDSMLTTRVYRPARPAHEALHELRRMSGSQFCPRCVGALEAIVATEVGDLELAQQPSLVD